MPIRTCVGCRERDEQEALLRVAQGPGGVIISRTAPGRGAWLHPGCGAAALRRKALQRALRADAGAPGVLAALIAEVDARARLGKTRREALDWPSASRAVREHNQKVG